jgi:hypothetical protein
MMLSQSHPGVLEENLEAIISALIVKWNGGL